jgi:hypothetical protein
MEIKQIFVEKKVSNSLKINPFDVNSTEFGKLNVPSSIGLGLPTEGFYVPEKQYLAYAKMEYTRLLNKQGKPTIGIGLAVLNSKGETVVISVGSLFKSFYTSEPPTDPKDATKFITRGIERVPAFDILEGVQTMNYSPTELIEKYFAGKFFKKHTDADVFIPKYNDEHELIAYEAATKPLFSIDKNGKKEATKATTESESETAEKLAKNPKATKTTK